MVPDRRRGGADQFNYFPRCADGRSPASGGRLPLEMRNVSVLGVIVKEASRCKAVCMDTTGHIPQLNMQSQTGYIIFAAHNRIINMLLVLSKIAFLIFASLVVGCKLTHRFNP